MQIINFLKKIKKIILIYIGVNSKPQYIVNIIKTKIEDFNVVKYKGTNTDSIRSVASIQHPETRIGKLKYGKHISIRKTINLDMVGDITIGDYTIFSGCGDTHLFMTKIL